MAMASAPLLLLRRVELLEATLARHGVAVPPASAATRAACAAAVDTPDELGRTALWRACEGGELAEARWMLERGAAVNHAADPERRGCVV